MHISIVWDRAQDWNIAAAMASSDTSTECIIEEQAQSAYSTLGSGCVAKGIGHGAGQGERI